MMWHWRFLAADGSVIEGSSPEANGFHSQADAETWIGETWRELADGEVDAVTLLEGDTVIYGPMSLHPATES